MGLMQRTKGKVFERKIAALLRQRWPEAVVRRASQAERAHNPDVFVERGPGWLSGIWLELQDARNPNPRAKLEQAERDIIASVDPLRDAIIVWHRLAEHAIWATLRTGAYLRLLRSSGRMIEDQHNALVTMEIDDLLDVVEAAQRSG